jgi:hypothetical protein
VENGAGMTFFNDDKFRVTELSESQLERMVDLERWSKRYIRLALVCFVIFLWLIFLAKYVLVLLIWIIMQMTLFLAAYYANKAKDVEDE